jgi:hypothetical protein
MSQLAAMYTDAMLNHSVKYIPRRLIQLAQLHQDRGSHRQARPLAPRCSRLLLSLTFGKAALGSTPVPAAVPRSSAPPHAPADTGGGSGTALACTACCSASAWLCIRRPISKAHCCMRMYSSRAVSPGPGAMVAGGTGVSKTSAPEAIAVSCCGPSRQAVEAPGDGACISIKQTGRPLVTWRT